MATEKTGLIAGGDEAAYRPRCGGAHWQWQWRLTAILSLAVIGILGYWETSTEGFTALLQFPPAATGVPVSALSSGPSGDFDLYQHLGHLSPFFVPPNTPASLQSGTPPGCTVSKAFLIHRHGSRHPHADELAAIQDMADYADQIRSNSSRGALLSGDLLPPEWQFLRSGWKNTLGTDELTAVGRQQLFDHGVALRLRHPDLLAGSPPLDPGSSDDGDRDEDSSGPRALALAGGEDRVEESAAWFLAGYHGRSAGNTSAALRVLPEDAQTPSWITPHSTCGAWDDKFGRDPPDAWGAVYLPPIAARLNRLLAPACPAVAFTPAHVRAMFWACAYETAARGAGTSPWCGVFTRAEFLLNEYEHDLRQRGFSGYGLPGAMGPVLGSLLVGNVTAFLEEDTRATASAATAVVQRQHDRDGPSLALAFGHDKTLAFGLSALGLAADDGYPETGPPDPHRAWRAARLVPFASYMLWQRLECEENGENSSSSSSRIQLLLNGANYGLGPTGCTIDAYGTCQLEDFLGTEKVQAARNVTHGGAEWKDACEKE